MRIRIIGTTDSAHAIRASLYKANVIVCDHGFNFTVELIDTLSMVPTVDGVDSEIERFIFDRIAEVAKTPVLMLRPGGNRSDNYIIVGIPASNTQHLIERGIVQAIVRMFGVEKTKNMEPIVPSTKEPELVKISLPQKEVIKPMGWFRRAVYAILFAGIH